MSSILEIDILENSKQPLLGKLVISNNHFSANGPKKKIVIIENNKMKTRNWL